MGWPKGVPRRNHVNRDGSKHAAWGKKISQIKLTMMTAEPKKRGRKPKDSNTQWNSWKKLLVHPNGPFTEFCPNCEFPEADGGYCPNCGWTKPVKMGRVS